MLEIVKAIGTVLETVGIRLQNMTEAELACWTSVAMAFCVVAVLITVLVAIVLDWWEIAGRYVTAVFFKDRAADFLEWKERRARLKRLKAAHRANYDGKRR